MKVISTEKVLLHLDREGEVKEFVQIEIEQTLKDTENKEYHFHTKDMMVLDYGKENEAYQPVLNRFGQPQEKSYVKRYSEYDQQKKMLLEAYPSDLKDSELDDYLLLKALLYSTEIDTVYNAKFIAK